jgi:2-amino-4-hydroxy-6-hydroxymethyldihydropteridine diphosphokinase
VLAYLGLGSNLGDRRAHIEQALEALGRAGVTVVQRSSFYESAPRDVLDQPWFLNVVVAVETGLSAHGLLKVISATEAAGGRTREIRRGPRTVDIDILLFGDQAIHSPELEVPHPRMWQRRFVLEPLAEIDPRLVSEEALSIVADQDIRRLVD